MILSAVLCLVTQSYLTLALCDPMVWSQPDSSAHGNSPGKNAGVGWRAFLQGIFPPKNRTGVSCIAGGFFTSWAAGETWLSSPRAQFLFSSTWWYSYYPRVKATQLCLSVTPWTPWISLGQNTGVGSFSLFQGIFPTKWLSPGLPHCRGIFFTNRTTREARYPRKWLQIRLLNSK